MHVIKPQIFNPYEFSRGSSANQYDASGLLELVGVDVLRLGYNPTTLEFIGPIIEDEATNCIIKSNDFTDAAWTGTGTVPTVNPLINPAGGLTTSFIKGGAFSTATRAQELDNSDLASGPGLLSWFVKGKAPSGSGFYTVRLTIDSTVSTTGVFSVDPANYYALESFSGIEKLPNDWFRIWLYGPIDPSVTNVIRIAHTGSGDDQETYIWGAQFEMTEAGAPSSFIYTDTTVETREADVVIQQSPSVIESNIEENDAPVWDSVTAYTVDQQVMVLGEYHRVYKSTGSNTDKFPPGNPTDWIDTGATNRWRMFDMNVGADKQSISTESGGDIRVLTGIEERVNSVVILNLDAASIHIVMRDANGNVIYNYFLETLSLPDSPYWWGFYFGNRRRIRTIVRLDLPTSLLSTIEIIADGGDGAAKIGKLIIGNAILIGCARYGTSVGIVDFSRKELNDFGDFFVLERRYIDRCEYDIQLDTAQVDNVKEMLAEVRATPAVYIGSQNFKSTVVFGFYRDFSIVLQGPRKSACTLQAEGI